ncbi:hypothetical protein OsI_34400 [Oryza sativa Indica Group]|uniref:Uncharacterized protein n=1 Tax=Oryza sativa subsp. indica TaxID=39946 RepID=B8BHZ0_ORYSI|nr:hypothetical protein OsI_34400 [Oryza sativa Indica Group]
MSPPATAAAARTRQDHSAVARGGGAAGGRATSPAKPLTVPYLARRLPHQLHRRGALHFLCLFPRVFDLHDPLPLSLSVIAPAAELLAIATSPAAAAAGSGERWGDDDGEGYTSGAI